MRTAVVVGWSALLGIGACSAGSGPATADVPAAQACADNAHARCAQLQRCSSSDVLLRYGSESACETRETQSCATALAEPLNGNTPLALEACAAAYAGWTCADYLENANVPQACQQQLGPVENGGGCAVDGQCQSGFCSIAPGSSCGTCSDTPKAGASCALLISCGAGLTCTTDTFECVAVGVRGSPCGRGAVCGVGLSCVGADAGSTAQGVCKQAAEVAGVPCDPTLETGAGCDSNAGLACASATKICQPLVVAAAGQACGNDVDGGVVECQAEGVCSGASNATPGTCIAPAANGEACSTAGGPACAIPARCIGAGGVVGTCQYSGTGTCSP